MKFQEPEPPSMSYGSKGAMSYGAASPPSRNSAPNDYVSDTKGWNEWMDTVYRSIDVQDSPTRTDSPSGYSRGSGGYSNGSLHSSATEPAASRTPASAPPGTVYFTRFRQGLMSRWSFVIELNAVFRMSAAEMREQLSRKKKHDPKSDQMSMQQKFDIVRNL